MLNHRGPREPILQSDGTFRIPLTRSQFAVVDEEDLSKVEHLRWYAISGAYTSYAGHACRRQNGRQIHLRMHRVILGSPQGVEVDHINGDGLDNRRKNLRLCSHTENVRNSRSYRGASVYKGVGRNTYTSVRGWRKWVAKIRVNKHLLWLGTFDTEADAARAYDCAAQKHFGEFARPNFPEVRSTTETPQ